MYVLGDKDRGAVGEDLYVPLMPDALGEVEKQREAPQAERTKQSVLPFGKWKASLFSQV